MSTLTLQQATELLGAVATESGFKCQGWEGPCERRDASVFRQHTAYVVDLSNWVCLCPECAKGNAIHWDDMWATLY